MMMKLLRLPLLVAALALALCWLGADVQALKPVPSKTAVKAVPPPPARKADVTHKLNTIDMMIAVRASPEGGRAGRREGQWKEGVLKGNTHISIQGGFATAMGDLAMHPIDTIKTVQQAAPAVSAQWEGGKHDGSGN